MLADGFGKCHVGLFSTLRIDPMFEHLFILPSTLTLTSLHVGDAHRAFALVVSSGPKKKD
jgi:hypothetical protein